MCGRFIQISNPEVIKVSITDLLIDDIVLKSTTPRYNIAPTQNILTVLNSTPPRLTFTHWGLVPSWAKDKNIGYKMINARSETVSEKPSFKEPFKKRRGLILADGFYEWKKTGKTRIPYLIRMQDQQPFAFACLWDRWSDKVTGVSMVSSTILTTDANPLVGEIHDRMPVILEPDQYWTWLSSEPVPEQQLTEYLHPYPHEKMVTYEVSSLVNKPEYDSPKVIEPVKKTVSMFML